MKRSEENRYAHSATLFKFCKEALNIKHNFEVIVIDQHVGALLGFDPADCSHWKKGKKNIRSIHTINTIAESLDIDARLVTDIVSGQVGLEESVQEFRGYGAFESTIDLQREQIFVAAQQLLENADIRSCPVLIPEVLSVCQNIALVQTEPESEKLVETTIELGQNVIRMRKGEMKPHIRFLLAREIGRVVLHPSLIAAVPFNTVESRLNTFAMLLLIPSPLLQVATREANNSRDLVQQLSDFFWMSRAVVNARIKDFFTHGN